MSTTSPLGPEPIVEENLFDLICELEVSEELSELQNQILQFEEQIRSHVTDDIWKLYLMLEYIESQYRLQLVNMVVHRLACEQGE